MEANSFQQPASWPIPLAENQVQIWRVGLELDEKRAERMYGLLAPDERNRADRFYFPHLRIRYIAARSALRILAGALTGEAPQSLTFGYAQHGKPYIPGSRPRFNLAHTEKLALIGLTLDREIGVDIEFSRPLKDLEQIARRFFSAAETAELLALPEEQRLAAFYACWTRKEAYIKAIGDGLSFPLDRFRVSLQPDVEARLLEVQPDPGEVLRWKMIAVDPGRDYFAAVLAEGPDWHPVLHDFELSNERLNLID